MRDASQRRTQHWKVTDQMSGKTYWFNSEEHALYTAMAIEKATFVGTAPVYSLSGHYEGETE